MNVSAIVVSAALAAVSASGAAPVLGTVNVCVEGNGATPFVVNLAETRAGWMFEDVGVKIKWLHSRRNCQARPEDTISIHLTMDAPGSSAPGTLAYALPYDGAHIVVFYDRIMKTTEETRWPHLLAHVLVHEVTHILQGVSRHSDEGMMKANWNKNDYIQMFWKGLPFAPMDVTLIHLGLQARTSRIALQRQPRP
jgi:hypothetical protein